MKAMILLLGLAAAACSHQQTRAGARQTSEEQYRRSMTDDERSIASAWGGVVREGGVERIQGALVDEGFLEATSGKVDVATRDALRAFQRSRTLPVTGVPDENTVSALGLTNDEVLRPDRK